MTLRTWQLVALLAATFTTGTVAGVFGLYAHTVMPGLGGTDDRTFIGAFQALDRAIINPLFMVTFLGALAFTAVAAVLCLLDDDRSVLVWVAVAFALYLAAFVITIAVNVPLNDELKAAGSPDQLADPAAVRAAFDESRWIAWNLVRTVATVVAFACLLWTLVLHGRADDSGDRRAASPAPAASEPR
jgi:uncharacterized membrane protein